MTDWPKIWHCHWPKAM